MNDITKMIKSLKESGLLVQDVSETIKSEAKKTKKQKGVSLSILLGILGANVLGNLLTGKGAIATTQGRGTIRTSEGTIRAGEGTIKAVLYF